MLEVESKEIIIPPKPSSSIKELKDNDPEKWMQIETVIDDLLEIAKNTGNSKKDINILRLNFYRSLDIGLLILGLDQNGQLTLLMWHFTKGVYLPMISGCFNRLDAALSLQISNYLLSVN